MSLGRLYPVMLLPLHETSSPLLVFCSPHKDQWRGALMFSLIFAWMKDWVNNRATGNLRCHRSDYDATLMKCIRLIYKCLLFSSLNIFVVVQYILIETNNGYNIKIISWTIYLKWNSLTFIASPKVMKYVDWLVENNISQRMSLSRHVPFFMHRIYLPQDITQVYAYNKCVESLLASNERWLLTPNTDQGTVSV